MNTFTVSVIVPVYNAENFVAQAVESALACKEVLEVILIEDHSLQNDWEICQLLLKKYPEVIKLYRTPVNMGAGAARNIGLQNATQPFIAFLDADDVFLPHRFEADKSVLANNPNCDGVYNALGNTYWDESGKLKFNNKVEELTCPKGAINPDEMVYECSPLGIKGHIQLDTITIRNKVIYSIGDFNEAMRLSQDTEWITRLLAEAIILKGNVDQAVALRGLHYGNRSSDKEKLEKAHIELNLSLLKQGLIKKYPAKLMHLLFNRYVGYYLKQYPGKTQLLKIYFKWIFIHPMLVIMHFKKLF